MTHYVSSGTLNPTLSLPRKRSKICHKIRQVAFDWCSHSKFWGRDERDLGRVARSVTVARSVDVLGMTLSVQTRLLPPPTIMPLLDVMVLRACRFAGWSGSQLQTRRQGGGLQSAVVISELICLVYHHHHHHHRLFRRSSHILKTSHNQQKNTKSKKKYSLFTSEHFSQSPTKSFV